MPEFLSTILQGANSIVFIIGLLLLWKTGLLKWLIELKKNGNGNGVSKQLKTIQENHLHDLAQKLDRIIELLIEIKAENKSDHNQLLRK